MRTRLRTREVHAPPNVVVFSLLALLVMIFPLMLALAVPGNTAVGHVAYTLAVFAVILAVCMPLNWLMARLSVVTGRRHSMVSATFVATLVGISVATSLTGFMTLLGVNIDIGRAVFTILAAGSFLAAIEGSAWFSHHQKEKSLNGSWTTRRFANLRLVAGNNIGSNTFDIGRGTYMRTAGTLIVLAALGLHQFVGRTP